MVDLEAATSFVRLRGGTLKKRLFFRNWWKYQTYHKNARRRHLKIPVPPYVGNQTSMLGDPQYLALSLAERGCLHSLMILAAHDAGHIPNDINLVKKCINSEILDFEAYKGWFISCNIRCTHYPEGYDSKGNRLSTPSFQRDDAVIPKGREGKGREVKRSTTTTTGTAKKPPRQPTPFSICLEHFKRGHLEVLGLPYDESEYKRDNKLLAPKITTYGVPAVRECMDAFWNEQRKRQKQEETWIGKGAPTIPGFCRVFALIIQKYSLEGDYEGPRRQLDTPEAVN